MNCVSCGTELPVGAMFCGECGRAVSSQSFAPRRTGMPYTRAPMAFGARDTLTIEPLDSVDSIDSPFAPERAGSFFLEAESHGALLEEQAEIEEQPEFESAPAEDIEFRAAEPERDLAGMKPGPGIAEEVPETDQEPEREPEPEPDAEPDPEAADPELPSGQIVPSEIVDSRPDPFPWGNAALYDDGEDAEDAERTRILPRRVDGARFVLQFSTGESFTAFGTGLLGRNPLPQPGEYFDQLVVILDPGKSVSKTHLEFGQEGGVFWVSDRFSANGSIVREPDSKARRCEPGKRYRVVRGTRIDIGEQFFIVS